MDRFRFVLQSSMACFRRWRSAPRIVVLFGFIACLTVVYAMPFSENAMAQDLPLQFTEIFIALMNWRFTMLAFSSIILLLFGDLPIIESFTRNALICGTKRSWMASQIAYVFFTSAIVCMVIFLVTVAVAAPNLDFSNQWSRPVRLMAQSGRIAISPERMKLTMPIEIVTEYFPWQAFGHSISLFFLMSCIYGLGTLALNLWFRSGGFILMLTSNILSWSMGMYYVTTLGFTIFTWLSLHYHASLSDHSFHDLNASVPSLGISYVVMVNGICFLGLILMGLVKRYDFNQAEDDQR